MSDRMPDDEELRALYRQLPGEEPSAELDEEILTAARLATKAAPSDNANAVEGARRPTAARGNRAAGRRRIVERLRWSVPLAAAAGVLLTLTVSRYAPTPSPDVLMAPSYAPNRETMMDRARVEIAPSASESASENSSNSSSNSSSESVKADAAKSASAPAPASPPKRKTRDEGATIPAARKAAPPALALGKVPADPQTRPSLAEAPSSAEIAPSARMESQPSPIEEQNRARKFESRRLDDLDARENDSKPSAEDTDQLAAAAVMEVGPWPLGLRVGMPATQACRLVTFALHRDCVFEKGIAVVTLSPPVGIEHEKLTGRVVSTLTLTLHDGLLQTVKARTTVTAGGGPTDEVVLFSPDDTGP